MSTTLLPKVTINVKPRQLQGRVVGTAKGAVTPCLPCKIAGSLVLASYPPYEALISAPVVAHVMFAKGTPTLDRNQIMQNVLHIVEQLLANN